MKKTSISVIMLLFGFLSIQINAQTASTSDNIIAQQIADRSVPFDVTATGVSKTIKFGPDLAWANEQAFRRCILFMGKNQVDLVRASFQPTYPLVNGTSLTNEQITDLDYRLYLINTYVGSNTTLALNCDHPSVDPWYVGYPSRWHQLIKTSAQRYKNASHNIVTVGAFNEPDYGWGQGSNQDMYDITALMKNDSFFNGVRLGGGNTLNCDAAQGWYDYLVPAGVTEGNTHQLAGSFDGFASFFQNVRANGHYATDDELHNIVEALVGYEYGMQTGIWWADIDLASGEMVKAFDGQRLGYAEHRPNWTAAAVYRAPDGKVQAFGGTSERQAVTTTYNYISKDRVVYFDGQGPSHEFVLEMPGGAPGSYGNGQSNAERVINITYGDDIQPVINGEYMIVNRSNGQVMQISGRAKDGTNVLTGNYSGSNQQHWKVTPVNSDVGGDFSYFRINPSSSSRHSLDLYGYNLDNGGNIDIWTTGLYGNHQWFLDYAEDGYFYIRSRESSKCVVLESGGTNVQQWEKITGDYKQQWRLLPVGVPIEYNAPPVPANLTATANAASIKLNWTASSASDLAGYTIFRSESANGVYNTIARKVMSTSFVDNTVLSGTTYYYKIRAVDNSLNRSAYSNQVSATASGANAIVAQYNFDGNTQDASVNFNKCAVYGTNSYVTGKVGSNALSLNGSSNFVQLPAEIANHQSATVATWVYWNGGSAWQRIFDFGNSKQENMFFTSNNSSGKLEYTVVNGGSSQTLVGPSLATGTWVHVALTLSSSGTKMYVNGQAVAQSSSASISPRSFRPVQNYIGRSQWEDPLLNGRIDDFRIYNYALSASEIAALAGTTPGGGDATTMAVQSIITGTANAGKGKKYGTSEITIFNDQGAAVSGATVYGTFSGTFSQSVSGVTGADGKVSFQTSASAGGSVSVDFCVTNVTHSSLTYNSAQNVITCTGSSAKFDNGKSESVDVQFSVHPNPTSAYVTITLADELISGSLVDMNGRSMEAKITKLAEGSYQVDMTNLSSGVYLLVIDTPESQLSKKIIKE